MKTSVVITTLNEEKTVSSLLTSLLSGIKKPDEIIVVDGGSKDNTIKVINHFQKKDKRIKLLRGNYSRAEGRNVGVEIAKNEIIAMTDAGCKVQPFWLKRIVEPYEKADIDMVAGFYEMKAETSMAKGGSYFLGTTPKRFDINFLPATRSISFTKEIWEKAGGFPEKLKGTAEDSFFIARTLQEGTKIVRAKGARVEWRTPEKVSQFFRKLSDYAKGDFESKIWIHPGKGFSSHNIKVIFVFFRYFVGLILFFKGFENPLFWLILATGLIIYIGHAYRKVYAEFGKKEIGLWGTYLQFVADLAVMTGFVRGLIGSGKVKTGKG